ncbi:hypothetical protein AB0937_37855 [Streptomyces sp. NPDC047880]|uniref:hypothetical protein n=1 Tax=Streptomyces sp. NPDC047880 TaxID=3155626 RepID=UPI0034552182
MTAAQVTFRLQRLLEEFAFSGDGEADFERLDGEVDRIREEKSSIDPVPFQEEKTVWSVEDRLVGSGR